MGESAGLINIFYDDKGVAHYSTDENLKDRTDITLITKNDGHVSGAYGFLNSETGSL